MNAARAFTILCIFAAITIFTIMRSFGSDNHSGVHPDILKAIEEANKNHCIAYGDDPWTQQAQQKIKDIFGENAEVFFVFNGTGANVMSLKTCVSSFHSILCPDTAHIAVDECGAPEFITGAALKSIPTPDGKLTPALLKPQMSHFGFEHHSQPKAVYISQCSELGTVYTIDEIKAIADYIHTHNMYLHMDGARIANAAVSLNKSLKEISVDCGVDILSFGGTKNGMMLGEAIVSFKSELSENMKYIRKQSAQLYSKMRFVSAQFIPYLTNDIWKQNAIHANHMARYLRSKIEDLHAFTFTQATDANIILMKMPSEIIERLLQKHFFYIWNENEGEIRLVTSWDTSEDDIKAFIEDLHKLI